MEHSKLLMLNALIIFTYLKIIGWDSTTHYILDLKIVTRKIHQIKAFFPEINGHVHFKLYV
jgi:hypothetical protein